jgi:hypothetical protein
MRSGFGPVVNPVQKLFFVQEEIASQYALEVKLLKKIARGQGYLTKRVFQIPGFPGCENFACAELRYAGFDLMYEQNSPFATPLAKTMAGLNNSSSAIKLE